MRAGVVVAGAMVMVLASALGAAPAVAGGSLSLDDALTDIFKASPKLVAEVEAARRREPDPTANVICDADIRLGSSWEHLSATRVVPIECYFTGKTLKVNGKVTFKDAKGRILREIGPKTFRNAVTVEQTDLTWTWE